ncbi:hypothetical protein CRG98_010357 [Punica granatum]|uniref:Molybdenum cofactor sulfurase middle domain-containing protein n=1 Tax=Punica granatum TaxID=22663 RepID=A0A2I0KLL6_PUNGR|nr:hypothetical protein CRG98_010357 [Punica granatum]
MAAIVSSLFIYPIKSCRGISVPAAPLTPTGLRWDRQWLVVNSKGRAYTQRVEPKLALVVPELPNDAFLEDWVPSANSYLVLKAPGMSPLKVSLSQPGQITEGISVWEWSGSALDEGEEAAKWFSDYLGKPSRLVRFNADSQKRPVDAKYAPGHKTMFSDGYPFLLISQTFRSDKALRPNGKPRGLIYFGQNLVLKESLAGVKGKIIKAGDPVNVLKMVSSPAEAAV